MLRNLVAVEDWHLHGLSPWLESIDRFRCPRCLSGFTLMEPSKTMFRLKSVVHPPRGFNRDCHEWGHAPLFQLALLNPVNGLTHVHKLQPQFSYQHPGHSFRLIPRLIRGPLVSAFQTFPAPPDSTAKGAITTVDNSTVRMLAMWAEHGVNAKRGISRIDRAVSSESRRGFQTGVCVFLPRSRIRSSGL